LKNGSSGKLLDKEKLVLRSRLLRDGVIWSVPKNTRYPDGVRYRLALVDVDSGQLVTLFDNHSPKGHHRHWSDGRETSYYFESVEKLVDDYLTVIEEEEKRREDKKD
jgi:hypothetical protein